MLHFIKGITSLFLHVGLLRMFDLYCRPVYEMQILLDFHASVTITECHFYGNGVACMTSDDVIRVVEVQTH